MKWRRYGTAAAAWRQTDATRNSRRQNSTMAIWAGNSMGFRPRKRCRCKRSPEHSERRATLARLNRLRGWEGGALSQGSLRRQPWARLQNTVGVPNQKTRQEMVKPTHPLTLSSSSGAGIVAGRSKKRGSPGASTSYSAPERPAPARRHSRQSIRPGRWPE